MAPGRETEFLRSPTWESAHGRHQAAAPAVTSGRKGARNGQPGLRAPSPRHSLGSAAARAAAFRLPAHPAASGHLAEAAWLPPTLRSSLQPCPPPRAVSAPLRSAAPRPWLGGFPRRGPGSPLPRGRRPDPRPSAPDRRSPPRTAVPPGRRHDSEPGAARRPLKAARAPQVTRNQHGFPRKTSPPRTAPPARPRPGAPRPAEPGSRRGEGLPPAPPASRRGGAGRRAPSAPHRLPRSVPPRSKSRPGGGVLHRSADGARSARTYTGTRCRPAPLRLLRPETSGGGAGAASLGGSPLPPSGGGAAALAPPGRGAPGRPVPETEPGEGARRRSRRKVPGACLKRGRGNLPGCVSPADTAPRGCVCLCV